MANKLPEKIELTMRAYGFSLLRQEISFLFAPLEFDVNELTNNRLTESRRNSFIIPARNFLSGLSASLSSDIEILGMNPDTLFFLFDRSGEKRVKVIPDIRINLKKQHQLSGEISVEPDSVSVNGPKSVLDTISQVRTVFQKFDQLEETLEKEIQISGIKNVNTDYQSVKLKIPVEEFTEAQQYVPVTVKNIPDGINLKLFPSKVKVAYQVGLSRFAGIHPEDFLLTVDFQEIQKGAQYLKIRIEKTPAFIYAVLLNPEEIEYLIENK